MPAVVLQGIPERVLYLSAVYTILSMSLVD